MNKIILSCLIALNTQQALADNWFQDTPLQATYSALMAKNTPLAWQELQLALNQNNLDERYWSQIKKQILLQSHCGKTLSETPSTAAQSHIRLTIQKKSNLLQQGYQFKISLDDTQEKVFISFSDNQGTVLFSGYSSSLDNSYSELEGGDMISAPTPGLYQLRINKKNYPAILSSHRSVNWINLENTHSLHQIQISPPQQQQDCPLTSPQWQWFDKNYTLLGSIEPMSYIEPISSHSTQQSTAVVDLPYAPSIGAKWISAVISRSEYQGQVRVNYSQRLTLPAVMKTNR
uniref:DUF2861 domain-containing protein n=1 Tax=Aliivibrio wodanis TaxID=80852 RepID=A0A5Q4ZY32_9GAMM|nr:hypothetical protein AW0309160_04276 [Aliivibrio wodanis]